MRGRAGRQAAASRPGPGSGAAAWACCGAAAGGRRPAQQGSRQQAVSHRASEAGRGETERGYIFFKKFKWIEREKEKHWLHKDVHILQMLTISEYFCGFEVYKFGTKIAFV